MERLNRTIIAMLATTIDQYGDDWETHLAKCVLHTILQNMQPLVFSILSDV